MNKPKVVVTRTQFENEMERLRDVSDLIIIDTPNPPTSEELKQKISGATALFAHINDSVNAEIMDAAGPSLKVIAEFGVGYDNVDVDAANERNIAVANTPGVLTETTASFAFTLMQSAARRIAEADRFVRNGKWAHFEPLDLLGYDLSSSVLGIIGFGRIGSYLGKIANDNGMKVLYYNRSIPEETYGAQRMDSLEELLENSDVVSLHCPYTPETKNLITKKQLKLMKKSSTLINTARGPIVNLDDLYESLSSGVIAYAVLDVTDPEPINMDHPILNLDNLTILPHIASATVETRKKMSKMTVDNILEGLQNKLPTYCVNSENISW
ncbi:MAG: D-glycerate dehydrogenase [Dehalococcoidia bacterium]|nr:D-glycerate dehydrogenase [Dehalococcoidia bacterium]|tara:strand:+ start:56 stop:1033 length:978 start_codon:yes stop_codon:yes gene_type:complete